MMESTPMTTGTRVHETIKTKARSEGLTTMLQPSIALQAAKSCQHNSNSRSSYRKDACFIPMASTRQKSAATSKKRSATSSLKTKAKTKRTTTKMRTRMKQKKPQDFKTLTELLTWYSAAKDISLKEFPNSLLEKSYRWNQQNTKISKTGRDTNLLLQGRLVD